MKDAQDWINYWAVDGPASAGSYEMLDGTRILGDPIKYDEVGVLFKTGDDSFSQRISYGRFTDPALHQLFNEGNPQHRAFIAPMLSEDTPAQKAPFREINVKQIVPPLRPSGHLGVLAIFTSPLGWMMLLLLYAANLFAAYEIAIFRNQPLSTVCGLAAIPLFGVASSLYFLALPARVREEDESALSDAAAPASYAPTPLPSAAAAPEAGEITSAAAWAPPGPSPVAAAPSREDLPAPVVYQRGDFSFNRRFFETKLTGFFRVVLSEADKDLLIHIKAARGDFVGKRISRITPSELYLQVFKENATAEEMIPFVEILEVQIRHKDLA